MTQSEGDHRSDRGGPKQEHLDSETIDPETDAQQKRHHQEGRERFTERGLPYDGLFAIGGCVGDGGHEVVGRGGVYATIQRKATASGQGPQEEGSAAPLHRRRVISADHREGLGGETRRLSVENLDEMLYCQQGALREILA